MAAEGKKTNYVALSARGQALDMNLQALASANNGERKASVLRRHCDADDVMSLMYACRLCYSGPNDPERDGEPPQPPVLQNSEQDGDELRRFHRAATDCK